jgi:TonB family protein
LNGNPNSDSYTGNGGNGSGNGVFVSRGLQGRKINRFPSFKDDFSENAKVAVDIKVDNNGNVTSATIQPRGTTTGNANLKNIALKKARQLKFTADEDGSIEQMGTIIFSFRVKQ